MMPTAAAAAPMYDVSDGNRSHDNAGDKERKPCSNVEPPLAFFQQARNGQLSAFPSSSSVEYLWEFGSLADFIKDRKLDPKNRKIMQKQQSGLSRHCVARRERLDAAAKRAKGAPKRSCASSEATTSDVHDEAPTRLREDPGAEQASSFSTGLHKPTTAVTQEDSRVEERLNAGTELNTATSSGDEKAVEGHAGTESSQKPLNADEKIDEVAALGETPTTTSVEPENVSTGGQDSSEAIVNVEEEEEKLKLSEMEKTVEITVEKTVEVTVKKTVTEVTGEHLEKNGTLDWIDQMVDEREKWMLEGKSNPEEEEGSSVKPASVQDRIRTLEDKLTATRTALQSGRQALGEKGAEEEALRPPSNERLAEVRDASDELEFTENKILRAYNELTTTRAQVAALEGKHGLDIMEVREAGDQSEKKIERATAGLQSLRAARVVWPHPAREVYLIGSFDGWTQKIKMDISSAGVFVATVPLHPGQYEVKFIVDGTWRVDTARPIVYAGGYENNILTIPESFTKRR